MSRIGSWLANAVDCALNRMAPIEDYSRNYLTTLNSNADKLADAEALIDVWEPQDPPLADWEIELRDAFLAADKQPTGTGVSPRPGAGGSPTDAEVELVRVTTDVLRKCGVRWPYTVAGIVARDLMHHFTVQPK